MATPSSAANRASTDPASPELPTLVIGAGPTGLATAAHLMARGMPVVVLEAGDRPASGVRAWGHVRLFSSWAQLVDDAARKLLAPTGWVEPDPDAFPTGAEWVARYLDPLAAVLGDETVLTGYRVVAVSRQGVDRLSDTDRNERPYVVVTESSAGTERWIARAVIDASGTTATPNPLGADGLIVPGEREHADRIETGVPDLTTPEVARRHAGQHTAVVGTGHTAMTALVGLHDLARREPGTRISWIRRRPLDDRAFGGGTDDELARRGALGTATREAVADGSVGVVPGFRTAAVEDGANGGVRLVAHDGRVLEVDRVVLATGYRPDLSLAGEVRLDLDPVTQAPRALGPLIDPNVHSCGTVPPHGEAELRHPDEGFYTVGMKSYGRAPTFLAITGYEQVRSIVAHLDGDVAAAAEVQLVLPETGVCSGSGLDDPGACGLPAEPASGCC